MHKHLLKFFVVFVALIMILQVNTTKASANNNVVAENYQIINYSGEGIFSLYLRKDNNLYSAGSNTRGQLGIGEVSAQKRFVPQLILQNIKLCETGRDDFAVAVTNDNKIYTWGSNKYAQLGNGSSFNDNKDANTISVPQEISIANVGTIVKVSAGIAHVLVLDDNGSVWSFGDNSAGQLGQGLEMGFKQVNGTPTRIEQSFFDNQKIIDIATTEFASFALTQNGRVYSWGENDGGQLGIGESSVQFKINTPKLIESIDNIIKISARSENVMLLNSENEVFSFGSNLFKQLGVKVFAEKRSTSPIKISKVWLMDGTEINNPKIIDIACGGITNFILDENGFVYSFGQSSSANAGYNIQKLNLEGVHPIVNVGKIEEPLRIQFYVPRDIVADTNNLSLPEDVKGKLPLTNEKQDVVITKLVNSIGSRTFVMDKDGFMWSWGDNSEAQVCSGDVNMADRPVRSTLFRNDNYDKTIPKKNYLIVPIVVTSVVLGLGAVYLIYLEIKNGKTYREEARAEKEARLRRKGKIK